MSRHRDERDELRRVCRHRRASGRPRHISQLADRFVKDPRDVVNPGDRITVRVIEVNLEKKQIALSMKSEARTERPQPRENTQQPRQQNRPPERRDKKPERTPAKGGFNNPFADLANWKK